MTKNLNTTNSTFIVPYKQDNNYKHNNKNRILIMKAHFELKNILQDINGESYESYKSIKGEFLFNDYILYVDHVQEDAFSSPSNMRVKIAQSVALFPDDTYSNRSREVALRDFITRKFYESIQTYCEADIDLKESGPISIENPGQEILERSTAFIDQSYVEIRFTLRLPCSGNNVEGDLAEDIIFNKLRKIISNSLLFENLDKEALYQHIKTYEDADFLRNELENLRLIAFVAEGSILPRRSDNSSLPMESDRAIPFISPNNLKMDVELPNMGQITGLGIPRGITFILGSDSNARSTLLNAIAEGIYNHIPGDGREYVVSNPNSVKIGAEIGRNVKSVNISAFCSNIEDSISFSTENADFATSRAANIVEAVEVGADVLLLDDNTDTYIEKAAGLFNEYMVSSIIAAVELDKYYDIANYVIQINHNKALDMALEAKDRSINNLFDSAIGPIAERIPLEESIDSSEIDLSSIEHIVSDSQKHAISEAVEYAKKYMDGKKSFRQVCSLVMLDIGRVGLDVLNPKLSGNYAEFRKLELAAAINRLKTLKVE
ncbi:MAG: ATPase [Thermodesulfobacteriota bacterium]|nr:MAG: ATPase [Thermodesulfobacteriota bacterium]